MLAFHHQGRGVAFASLRTLGVVSATQRVATKTIVNTVGSDLRPQRLHGNAYRKGGRVDLAVMPLNFLVEKRRDWSEPRFLLQLDVADASGSVDYLTMSKADKAKVGT